jgi:hypothetical protein
MFEEAESLFQTKTNNIKQINFVRLKNTKNRKPTDFLSYLKRTKIEIKLHTFRRRFEDALNGCTAILKELKQLRDDS